MKYTSYLYRAAQAVKPHIPSIKFRGSQVSQHNLPKGTVSKGAPASSEGGVFMIDERQLPARFRRTTIDENEINCINSGGAL